MRKLRKAEDFAVMSKGRCSGEGRGPLSEACLSLSEWELPAPTKASPIRGSNEKPRKLGVMWPFFLRLTLAVIVWIIYILLRRQKIAPANSELQWTNLNKITVSFAIKTFIKWLGLDKFHTSQKQVCKTEMPWCSMFNLRLGWQRVSVHEIPSEALLLF